ncbi:helix-turn-helix transcriptional regulator [Hungatella sp.]|jgi:PadR family transcriptional regulator, regulatory protein PadR|uniref:PadR family transcriptional regulator n=1 Tax=Hungatella sp. TaxID=2613924 RepID=UPI002A8337A6|nr:helix-turn-helix transcriptional regulator [Hungatella sp.]
MDKKYMAVGSSMLILKLLEQQDMYGYQIIKELEIRSERVFTLKEGTLYPLLHALEQDGAVICEQRNAENGRERKYYIITESGRKLLQDKLKEWDSFQTAVNQVIGGVLFG